MSWLEPLAEQQIQLRYDYQTSRHVIHISLIQVDMVCLEDCPYVNPSGGQFLHLPHKYSYHFVPNKRFKLHQMGFQRRLVPRKRFMRYKMRTVLEKGVGII